MRLRQAVYLVLLTGVAAACVYTTAVSRQVIAQSDSTQNFVVTDFEADYRLTNTDEQGQLQVTEKIQVNFAGNNHGIVRAIPTTYNGHDLELRVDKVSSPTGTPSQYTMYKSNDNQVLRIGDPDRTVTGRQSYQIEYTVRNVIGFYKDHDELYWDVNGDQWQQPFTHVKATLHTQSGLPVTDQKCFTGAYGSTAHDCTIQKTSDGFVMEANNLKAGETMSFVASMPKGTFVQPTWLDWARDHLVLLIATIVTPLLVGWWAFQRWWREGKDLKGRGVIVPEYDAPAGLSPAEAGTILDNSLQMRAITATIIQLAIRKYIRVEEVVKDGLLKKSKKFQLVLLNADWTGLKQHEVEILTALFPDKQVNSPVEIKKAQSFYKTYEKLQTSIPDDLTIAGYYPANPVNAGKGMLATGIGLGVLAGFLHSVWSGGLIIAAVLLAFFGKLMPRRTAKGVAAMDHIKGLKMYMDTAEADRLKMMQSPDSPYAQRGPAPVRTVELFEKLLPFAIAVGVEKAWAKEFKDIYQQPPDWYMGNWAAFNTGVLIGSLNNSMSAMNQSFSPPSSSSGSGFSGGDGFSGGGGGGGGGGGW